MVNEVLCIIVGVVLPPFAQLGSLLAYAKAVNTLGWEPDSPLAFLRKGVRVTYAMYVSWFMLGFLLAFMAQEATMELRIGRWAASRADLLLLGVAVYFVTYVVAQAILSLMMTRRRRAETSVRRTDVFLSWVVPALVYWCIGTYVYWSIQSLLTQGG